jgi:hypothetical protein
VQLGYPDVEVFADGAYRQYTDADIKTRRENHKTLVFPMDRPLNSDDTASASPPTPAEWIDMWQRGLDEYLCAELHAGTPTGGDVLEATKIRVELAEGPCAGCGAEP